MRKRNRHGTGRRRIGIWVARATFVGLAGPVATIPVRAAEQSSALDAVDGDAIVVMARRREERAQDVPIAISVFGGAALDRKNIYTLDQLKRQAPSLQIIGTNPRNTNINIRGLGANVGLQNDGLENGVGVYIDDVYYARTGQAVFDLVDLDRIELLRGPQGTLFGKNTTGGAISIYTKAPSSFKPELRADASVGSFGYYQLRDVANLPLVDDQLAVRLAMTQTAHNGWVRNQTLGGRRINDYNSVTVRGQIFARFGEATTLRVIGDYADQHEDGFAAVGVELVNQYRADGTLRPNSYLDRVSRFPGFNVPPFDPSARNVYLNRLASVKMTQAGGSAKLESDLGPVALTSITAYRTWNWSPRNDADGTSLDLLAAAQSSSRQRQFTQEVRLASQGKNSVDYVLGGFYLHQSLDSDNLTAYGSDAPAFLFGISPSAATNALRRIALDGFGVRGLSRLRLKSYAAFGQATWNISPSLNLTGGLRYTKETKDGTFQQSIASAASLAGLTGAEQATVQALRASFGTARSYAASTSESRLSGSLTLGYKPAQDVLLYGTFARGFKSGGLTLTNVAPGTPVVIDPETVTHYEVGVKSGPADGRWTLNVAGFWTIDANYQATQFDPDRITTYVSNVGKVRVRGVEVEGRVKPLARLDLYASGTYLDATYLDFVNAPCPIEQFPAPSCNLSGRPLAGAPKWAFAAGGDYRADIGGGKEAFLGIDYSYQSGAYNLSNDAPSSWIAGYGLVNARAGIRFGERIDLSVWARNLFDKQYLVTRTTAGFNTGLIQGLVGEPRSIGATLRLTL
ncbi:TonB-dependent receptor [Sphingobium sp. Sx8-8]|uniref:TonB-dependent receptor n=1 Tax=Sphingobium sp. Sx8-8 TaxID=2933617 RepID=UPI001F5A1F5D